MDGSLCLFAYAECWVESTAHVTQHCEDTIHEVQRSVDLVCWKLRNSEISELLSKPYETNWAHELANQLRALNKLRNVSAHPQTTLVTDIATFISSRNAATSRVDAQVLFPDNEHYSNYGGLMQDVTNGGDLQQMPEYIANMTHRLAKR